MLLTTATNSSCLKLGLGRLTSETTRDKQGYEWYYNASTFTPEPMYQHTRPWKKLESFGTKPVFDQPVKRHAVSPWVPLGFRTCTVPPQAQAPSFCVGKRMLSWPRQTHLFDVGVFSGCVFKPDILNASSLQYSKKTVSNNAFLICRNFHYTRGSPAVATLKHNLDWCKVFHYWVPLPGISVDLSRN